MRQNCFLVSFCVVVFHSPFLPWQEKVQRPKGHYWCDLSDSGLSKADLLNITDCSTSHLGREVRFWVWGVGDVLLMLVLVGGWFWADIFFEFPGLDCQKVELGTMSELTMDSQDWEVIRWSTSMHGCRSIIMIFTRYRRCPSTSLRKNNSPLGWIDSDICFACLREKTDVTDAFTCAQN